MKVLDATFLIDYGNEEEETAEYLLENRDERFLIPAPIYTEYLLGAVHGTEEPEIEVTRSELSWAEVVEIDEEIAVVAAEVADDIGPQGPHLTAIDALVAAVGRQLNAAVVSRDGDLTHQETKKVVDVEEHRA